MTTYRKKTRLIAALASVFLVFGSVFISRAASNEEIIFKYLTGKIGFNSAAACGILANIEKESSFRPTIYGDGGTSYGICQWHDVASGVGRFTNLKNFCAANGLDYTSLNGQLEFLAHELSSLKTITNYLRSVDNTAAGAYDAGYYWCYNFEIPGDRENQSKLRGELARTKYWPLFGKVETAAPQEDCEVWRIKYSVAALPIRNGAGRSYTQIDAYVGGKELKVTQFVTDGEGITWAKIKKGWCEIKNCEWVSGAILKAKFVTNCATELPDVSVHYSQYYKLPTEKDLTKYGHTLVGWDLWGTKLNDPGYGVTVYGDFTAKAVWKRDTSVALVCGDANSDGKVNARDVTTVMKYILYKDETICLPSADVKNDLKINSRDVIGIMNIITDPSLAGKTVSPKTEEMWNG